MKNKERMLWYLLKNRELKKMDDAKPFTKIIFFQNPCLFRYCRFYIENISYEHRFLVYAIVHHPHLSLVKIAILTRDD